MTMTVQANAWTTFAASTKRNTGCTSQRKQTKVKTGIQDDKYIQITIGLDEGDQVVSAPYSAISKDLRDSSLVKVVPKDQVFATQQD